MGRRSDYYHKSLDSTADTVAKKTEITRCVRHRLQVHKIGHPPGLEASIRVVKNAERAIKVRLGSQDVSTMHADIGCWYYWSIEH